MSERSVKGAYPQRGRLRARPGAAMASEPAPEAPRLGMADPLGRTALDPPKFLFVPERGPGRGESPAARAGSVPVLTVASEPQRALRWAIGLVMTLAGALAGVLTGYIAALAWLEEL